MIRKKTVSSVTSKPVSRLVESLVLRAEVGRSAPLLLKALIALDALRRGKATTTLLTSLAQQLHIAEALCVAGYGSSQVESNPGAYAAVVRVYSKADLNCGVEAADAEYEALRDALVIPRSVAKRPPRMSSRR